MGLQHTQDHAANVMTLLGVDEPAADSKTLRFGMEVELGWEAGSQMERFFKALEAAGLDKQLISKHDGTIQAGDGLKTELVTRPLKSHRMHGLISSLGPIIEGHTTRGLITQGCGVHFHVSRAPLTRDQVWRAATAINQNHRMYGVYVRRAPRVEDPATWSQLSAFWDALALRSENRYCHRGVFGNIEELGMPRNGQGGYAAVCMGRATPTVEFRLFRTAKSTRVMLSYLEAIEALLEFSKAPPAALLHPGEVPPIFATRPWPSCLYQLPLAKSSQTNAAGTKVVVFICQQTGATYRREDVVCGIDGHYYPTQKHLDACQKILPLLAVTDPVSATHIGVVGWANGYFPLAEYIKFVRNNPRDYPALIKRLDLQKFKEVLDGAEALPHEHLDKPHLEFMPGCKVWAEGYGEAVFTIQRILAPNAVEGGGRGQLANLPIVTCINDTIGTMNFYINLLTHVCPGALEPGGES